MTTGLARVCHSFDQQFVHRDIRLMHGSYMSRITARIVTTASLQHDQASFLRQRLPKLRRAPLIPYVLSAQASGAARQQSEHQQYLTMGRQSSQQLLSVAPMCDPFLAFLLPRPFPLSAGSKHEVLTSNCKHQIHVISSFYPASFIMQAKML